MPGSSLSRHRFEKILPMIENEPPSSPKPEIAFPEPGFEQQMIELQVA
jgi:hypothetical protein